MGPIPVQTPAPPFPDPLSPDAEGSHTPPSTPAPFSESKGSHAPTSDTPTPDNLPVLYPPPPPGYKTAAARGWIEQYTADDIKHRRHVQWRQELTAGQETQILWMFARRKSRFDIAVELDIPVQTVTAVWRKAQKRSIRKTAEVARTEQLLALEAVEGRILDQLLPSSETHGRPVDTKLVGALIQVQQRIGSLIPGMEGPRRVEITGEVKASLPALEQVERVARWEKLAEALLEAHSNKEIVDAEVVEDSVEEIGSGNLVEVGKE